MEDMMTHQTDENAWLNSVQSAYHPRTGELELPDPRALRPRPIWNRPFVRVVLSASAILGALLLGLRV